MAVATLNRMTYTRDNDRRSTEELSITLGVVTSITREGTVKAWRRFGSDIPTVVRDRIGTALYVIPRESVALEDVESVAHDNAWEHLPLDHPYRWFCPFGSLDKLRDALRPYQLERAS